MSKNSQMYTHSEETHSTHLASLPASHNAMHCNITNQIPDGHLVIAFNEKRGRKNKKQSCNRCWLVKMHSG